MNISRYKGSFDEVVDDGVSWMSPLCLWQLRHVVHDGSHWCHSVGIDKGCRLEL